MSYFDDNEARITGLNLGRRINWDILPPPKEKMQVTIQNVDVQWNGEGRKKWGKAVVAYSFNGEARKQNVMSFTNPEVFKKVQELIGQSVDVELTKNDKGYSEWKSVNVSSAATAGNTTSSSGASATRVSGSNYETKEERAARQVLIVKQSSLSAAVETLKTGAKAPPDPAAIIDLAQQFVDWVFETSGNVAGSEDYKGDIPF